MNNNQNNTNGSPLPTNTSNRDDNSLDISETAQNVELMQFNGRKVLGPPEDWVGPAPSSACELFVRRILKDMDERKLLAPFLRFGRIYEVRLPVNFQQGNRGYAYVKYTNEEDASCAMEVLNHYFVAQRHRLDIMHSYDKSSLYITNLPKNLSEAEITEKLRGVFPNMLRLNFGNANQQIKNRNTVDPSNANNNNRNLLNSKADNRRHAFIQFPSHITALEAKKSVSPGVIRIWERDLKIVWANIDRNNEVNSSKTLFLRNVDSSVNTRDIIQIFLQHIPRTFIRNISKVRNCAFVNFITREAAEVGFKALHGNVLNGKPLHIEWAKSPDKWKNQMNNTDFDAILRLKCIANGWGIPIIIFGSYYEAERLQYGAVVLRDGNDNVKAIICIMNCKELVDIHSRMCEVACTLIESIGAFPDYNYVFQVERDIAHLLGMVTHNVYMIDFLASCHVPINLYFDLYEIFDMSSAILSLHYCNEETIMSEYLKSFQVSSENSYLLNWPMIPYRIFGTIMPKYRNMPPLRYKLNDTQIVLALCFKASGSNVTLPTRPYHPVAVSAFDNGYKDLPYIAFKLLPLEMVQSRSENLHVISHIQFGGTEYYHPLQRIMQPPLWITGCSYNASVKFSQTYFKPNEGNYAPIADFNNTDYSMAAAMPTASALATAATSASNVFPNGPIPSMNGPQYWQNPYLQHMQPNYSPILSSNISNDGVNISYTNAHQNQSTFPNQSVYYTMPQ